MSGSIWVQTIWQPCWLSYTTNNIRLELAAFWDRSHIILKMSAFPHRKIFSICIWCPKEQSRWDSFIEHPLHVFLPDRSWVNHITELGHKDEEPLAISMMQPDIAVKSTISCNRFLSLYFSLLLNITRRTINAALSFCHKREEDTFSCGLLMFSRPLWTWPPLK